MKLSVELDLTPQELRKILGLPDIENIQKAAIDKIHGRLSKAIDDAGDVEYLFQRILPLGTMGIDQLEKITRGLAALVVGSSAKQKNENGKSPKTGTKRKKKTTSMS